MIPTKNRRILIKDVLGIRNFLFLVFSSSVSQLGDRFTHMLLITVIGAMAPGRVFAYSQASLTFTLPVLLLSPITGVLIDRWDKRKVMITAHFIQTLILALTPLFIHLTKSFLPIFISLLFFFGIDIFNNTAKPALMPSIVAKRKLLTANAVDQTIIRIATVSGMLIGGFLIKWTGWRVGFFINALTHLSAGLFAMGIHYHKPQIASFSEKPINTTIKEGMSNFLKDLRALLAYLKYSKIVLFVLSTIFLITVVTSVSYTILIYLVQQVLKLGTPGVGIFAGTLAVGMIIGASILSFVKPNINRELLIILGVFAFGLLFVLGIFLIKPLFILIVGIVAGIIFSIIIVAQNTILQEKVPPDIRGRIFSTKEFLTNAAFILTAIPVGLLGDITSYKTILFSFGILLIIVGILSYYFFYKIS